ncbi:hypothetical protein RQP46_004001 [Phenoliferia psychrophenolica]
MPSLFHSETDLYLAFPSLTTVALHSKKDGEGTVQFTATSAALPLPAGTLHSLDIAHKLEPASYRVTETVVDGNKTYTVSALSTKFAGFATTMETAGLMHGKHLFQGPDNVHYNWSGKGDKLELLVPSDGNKSICEFEPEERKIELKSSRFGSHKDLDTEFVIASFFALLLFQDEYNKVHDGQDA